MQLYLQNILPRVKRFSESLDRKEVFVDAPWVMIDENLDQQKYIFKRNGELLMSLNGAVKVGKWEYLAGAKSLLIDRIDDKILLNQHFIDPVVMILSMDGMKEQNLILANETLLPDLDIVAYFKRLFHKKNGISEIELLNGEQLEIHHYSGYNEQNTVSINSEPVDEAVLATTNPRIKYVIKKSRIHTVLIMVYFDTDKGKIAIEHGQNDNYDKGDRVFQDSTEAPDGKYKISFFKSIRVLSGRIV